MNRKEDTATPVPEDAEPEAGPNASSSHDEPPKVYIASCGTLCDVFWWARRRPD